MSDYTLPQSAILYAVPGAPSGLTCAHCGQPFDVSDWQPRLRCPHCGVLGYPDRSGRNLLPLNWNCPSCGAVNDGSVNFCLTCGTGLASRCMRCESPVYSAVCDRCGTHQGQMGSFQAAEADRATWVPVLRERIRQQHLSEITPPGPMYGVTEWRAIDRDMREAVRKRQERHALKRTSRRQRKPQVHRGSRRRYIWGWLWVLVGLGWLIGGNFAQIKPQLIAWATQLTIPVWLQSGWDASLAWLAGWWPRFVSSLSELPGSNDLNYTLFYATAIFGLALLPIFLFLMSRVIRRLFP